MLAPWLRTKHPNGSNYRFDRAETGIRTITAVHCQCSLWVKSGQTVTAQNSPLSALVRYCCKSLFALGIKNSAGCRRGFRENGIVSLPGSRASGTRSARWPARNANTLENCVTAALGYRGQHRSAHVRHSLTQHEASCSEFTIRRGRSEFASQARSGGWENTSRGWTAYQRSRTSVHRWWERPLAPAEPATARPAPALVAAAQ